jgi:hypothetical protein
LGEGLGERGLADAGDVLDEDVPPIEEGDHRQVDGAILADDDSMDALSDAGG